MKYLIASDLHGDEIATKKLLDAYRREGAERLVLLGDILYHGPRNDLPAGYRPKGVIALLNEVAWEILAVRGNCDAEVDQMVLDFAIDAEYATLDMPTGKVYLTHGHHYNEDKPLPMQAGDVLVHGHSHVAGVTRCVTGQPCMNPGSLSIPKEGTPPSYILLENGTLSLHRLEDGAEWAKIG